MNLLDTIREAIGWLGSALLILAMLQTSLVRLRLVNIAASAALVAYNLWVGSIPMVAVNSALIVINVVGVIRRPRGPKEWTSREVSEEATDNGTIARTVDGFSRH